LNEDHLVSVIVVVLVRHEVLASGLVLDLGYSMVLKKMLGLGFHLDGREK
jgi:hypothetical protein